MHTIHQIVEPQMNADKTSSDTDSTLSFPSHVPRILNRRGRGGNRVLPQRSQRTPRKQSIVRNQFGTMYEGLGAHTDSQFKTETGKVSAESANSIS